MESLRLPFLETGYDVYRFRPDGASPKDINALAQPSSVYPQPGGVAGWVCSCGICSCLGPELSPTCKMTWISSLAGGTEIAAPACKRRTGLGSTPSVPSLPASSLACVTHPELMVWCPCFSFTHSCPLPRSPPTPTFCLFPIAHNPEPSQINILTDT